MDNCTFKPETGDSAYSYQMAMVEPADYSHINTDSVLKFIQRHDSARSLKQQAKEAQSSMAGTGQNWKNKVTRPITPKLLERQPRCPV